MKKPNPILHVLFSMYGWTVTFLFLVILTFVSLVLRLVLPYTKVHSIMVSFTWVLHFIFCPVKITYHPEYQVAGPYVLVQNHVNLLDAFIASKVSHAPLSGIMHRWQFFIPFYGWLMFLSKSISVDPKKKTNLQNMIRQAKQRRQEGISIITFPEGGRTLNGKCKPFHKGVFVMAKEAGYPVLPVAVRGNFQINQKGSFKIWPHPIEVQVGKPRSLENTDRKELDLVINEIRDEICRFVENHEKPDDLQNKP